MIKFAHAADFKPNEINNFPPLPEIIKYFLTLPDAYKKLQTIVNKASKGIFWDDDLQEIYEGNYLPLKDSAMQKVMESFTVHNINNYRVAIVESPQILSKYILAEKIFELRKDVNLVILFAPDGKVSIRRKPGSDIKCNPASAPPLTCTRWRWRCSRPGPDQPRARDPTPAATARNLGRPLPLLAVPTAGSPAELVDAIDDALETIPSLRPPPGALRRALATSRAALEDEGGLVEPATLGAGGADDRRRRANLLGRRSAAAPPG